MFLGTPRYWWIITIVIFVLALAFIGTDLGGTYGTLIGILLLFVSMIAFAASPRKKTSRPEAPDLEKPASAPAVEAPPLPRPEIVGRDASEV